VTTVNGYSLALLIHLLSVLLAATAMALAAFAGLQLRRANTVVEATSWLVLTGRIVRAFPVAVLGLVASGGYMIHASWSWSTPWVDAALVGLVLIVVLGNAVEGRHARALQRELESSGLSAQARRLLRDPTAWGAKVTTHTTFVAVVVVMTLKPAAVGCVGAITAALAAGAFSAIAIARAPRQPSSDSLEAASF